MIKFSKNIENFFQPVYPSRAEFCFCAHFPALWESSSAHPCHQMMFTLELQHWQTQSPCHKPWSPPLHWFSIAWCVCCVRVCMGKKELPWFLPETKDPANSSHSLRFKLFARRNPKTELAQLSGRSLCWNTTNTLGGKKFFRERCHNRRPQLILHRLVWQEASPS